MYKSKISHPSKLHVGIVTPTYNEIDNITALLKRIKAISLKSGNTKFSVLVVDDSSPDGTAEKIRNIAQNIESKEFSVSVTVRKKKDGLGRAYIHGFKQMLVLKPNVDFILQMDADLSHNPKYIKTFIDRAKNGADFITASRYIPGGDTPDWSKSRKILSKSGNLYARIILGKKITDYTGGFNMYSRRLLQSIDVSSLRSGGYGFLIELKHRALIHSQLVAEIPIIFIDRKHGKSKIPKSTMLKSFLLVLSIKLKSHKKSYAQ